MDSDTRFPANVSHELRSSLTTMVNAADLLQARRSELPATSVEIVDLLAAGVEQLRRTGSAAAALPTSPDGGR